MNNDKKCYYPKIIKTLAINYLSANFYIKYINLNVQCLFNILTEGGIKIS